MAGAVSLRVAAAHMGVGVRTLQRRLEDEPGGTVQLADGVRAIRVCNQWRVPVADLEEVFGPLAPAHRPAELVHIKARERAAS